MGICIGGCLSQDFILKLAGQLVSSLVSGALPPPFLWAGVGGAAAKQHGYIDQAESSALQASCLESPLLNSVTTLDQ